jgi:hypothetical protein
MSRRRIEPVRFRWIDWNRDKVLAHGLTTDDVEFAWHRGMTVPRGRDSFITRGRTPSGRKIKIIWKPHEQFEALELHQTTDAVFVITAY